MLGAGKSVLLRDMVVHVFLLCQEGVSFPYREHNAVAPVRVAFGTLAVIM